MRLTGKNRGKVLCDKCRQPLSAYGNGEPGRVVCGICGTEYYGAVFNVAESFLSRSSDAVSVRDREEAQCFFHPGKEAVEVCSVCGRMMCALCDIEQSGAHVCPSCINDRTRSDIDGMTRRSCAYVHVAWLLLLANFLVPVIPACFALAYAIGGLRNRDYSYSAGRKFSLALAALLAVPSILAMPLLVVMALLK